jgi:hypothetical protein
MSIARVHVSLVVCLLLGSSSGVARGQVPLAPPPVPAQAEVSPATSPPGTVPPGATPAPGTAPPGATPVTGPPAAAEAAGATADLVRVSIQAKAAGRVIEVTDEATISGCRELGDTYVDSAVRGDRGRTGIRNALKAAGRDRGASHLRYSDHVSIVDSGAQREHAHFYDCASRVPPSVATIFAFSTHLELVPTGTLHTKVDMHGAESDTSTAFGVSGSLEAIVSPYVAFGVNPGIVFGLKPDGAMSSAAQLDLRARMRVGKLTGDGLGTYGYVSGGGSWIVLPNDNPTSAGFVFGFGGGVTRRVDASLFVALELGFQLGFQNVTVADVETELSSNLFHIGLGFGGYL